MKRTFPELSRSATYAIIFAAIAGSTTCALATTRESSKIQEVSRGILLDAEGPRPLAEATKALIDKYGVAISYEDPQYVAQEDLQDVTALGSNESDKGGSNRHPVIVPTGGILRVTTDSKDVASIINQLVSVQNNAEHGGKFRVIKTGNFFHIVPSEVKHPDGNWGSHESTMDTRISIPAGNRNARDTIATICESLGKVAGVVVDPGFIMINSDAPKFDFEANNESARSVLMRALAITHLNYTWFLYYGDKGLGNSGYVLNLIPIPDRSSVPNVK